MVKEMIKVKQNIKNEETETHQIPITLGKELFQFSGFENWCNTAQRKFDHVNRRGEQVLCVDTFGRVCRTGREFIRARDEGAFPVRVFDQCF